MSQHTYGHTKCLCLSKQSMDAFTNTTGDCGVNLPPLTSVACWATEMFSQVLSRSHRFMVIGGKGPERFLSQTLPFIGKAPDAGKDWRQKKGMAEIERVGWPHRLSRHQSEQTGGIVEDRGTGRAVVHRAAKSRTRLRDRTTTSLYKWKKTGSGEVEQLMQESYIASLWQNQEESESPWKSFFFQKYFKALC